MAARITVPLAVAAIATVFGLHLWSDTRPINSDAAIDRVRLLGSWDVQFCGRDFRGQAKVLQVRLNDDNTMSLTDSRGQTHRGTWLYDNRSFTDVGGSALNFLSLDCHPVGTLHGYVRLYSGDGWVLDLGNTNFLALFRPEDDTAD